MLQHTAQQMVGPAEITSRTLQVPMQLAIFSAHSTATAVNQRRPVQYDTSLFYRKEQRVTWYLPNDELITNGKYLSTYGTGVGGKTPESVIRAGPPVGAAGSFNRRYFFSPG